MTDNGPNIEQARTLAALIARATEDRARTADTLEFLNGLRDLNMAGLRCRLVKLNKELEVLKIEAARIDREHQRVQAHGNLVQRVMDGKLANV